MASTARFGYIPKLQGAGLSEGLIQVRFQGNTVLYLTDKYTRFFRGGQFQEAISEVHRKAAKEIQAGMVKELERRVRITGRPQGDRREHKQGALIVSLKDERNTVSNASGFLVGIDSWLERSPAQLYWRRIEEGDATTFDSVGGTMFTTNFSTWAGPYSQGGIQSQSMHRYKRSGGKTQLISHGAPGGYPHMRMIQRMGRGGVIQNVGPYPAYNYSRGGQAAFDKIRFKERYATALKAHGITLTSDMIRPVR